MRRAVEAGSKLAVVASAILALRVETRMGWMVWDGLTHWTIAAAIAAGLLARVRPSIVWPVLLAAGPLVPVGLFAVFDAFPATFYAPWFAAVLAAALCSPGARLTSWSFDEVWRAPLACWALVVAVGWPLAAWREIDFATSLSSTGGFGANALTGNGGQPSEVLGWMATVALSQLIGLLFLDWASGEMRRITRQQFRARVVVPSAAGAMIAAALACYQGVVDVHFLNAHQWPALGRAGGGLLDGDASGALMGTWVAGFAAFALIGKGAYVPFGLAGMALSLGGLWATGSRMALLGALISVTSLGLAMLRLLNRRVRWSVFGALIAAAVMVAVVARNREGHNDPLMRAISGLPSPTVAALKQFARTELFDRTAPYGTVSVRLMKQYPVGGVGLGSFETLFPDFAYERDHYRYDRDNAQSWYRSQLAELGLLGSVGWIVWLVVFAGWLWRSSAPAERRAELFLVKTALVVVGVVALIAMPTRSALVGFSVWLFVAWALSVADDRPDALGGASGRRWMNAPAVWLAVAVIPLVTGADIWRTGHRSLRPVSRAAAFGWTYQYGLYPDETFANGERFRWTSSHAVSIAHLDRMAWLRIAIRSGPPDLSTRAFGYRLWVRGKAVASFDRVDGSLQVFCVKTYPYESDLPIEIKTTRPWRGTDFDGTDPRELGVMVDPWTVIDAPPPGAIVIR